MPAPVRRCAPCNEDWPNTQRYNLCPRCQRCTFASTADAVPDREAALKESARLQRYRNFDAECDAKADISRAEWDSEMEALLELTQSIPDPTPADDA